MPLTIRRRAFLGLAASTAVLAASTHAQPADQLGTPPPGFTSAEAQVNGMSLHYVRGGQGPAIILIHGFPETWVEWREIMPRLAKRFTVVAVDLPGIGKSAPAPSGYEAVKSAGHIHALAQTLKLERPYVVGHDLGGIVTYAYIRRFPDNLRGAMILDVPIPGLDGWDEAVADFWHIKFIQVPGQLAEKMVDGRQSIYIGHNLEEGKFTAAERTYYIQAYDAPQLHAAFEIYRAFPKDAEFNAAQTAPNSTPLAVVVGEQSFFAPLLPKFIEGYRAKGMTRLENVRIAGASHYVMADKPEAVAEVIERHAGK